MIKFAVSNSHNFFIIEKGKHIVNYDKKKRKADSDTFEVFRLPYAINI